MDRIKELELELEELRKEVRCKDISFWKLWQYKQDNELLRKSKRICEINEILKELRLYKRNLLEPKGDSQ